MQPMGFSTFHIFSQPPWYSDREVLLNEIEQGVWDDELGFDEAWLAEHNGPSTASPARCR